MSTPKQVTASRANGAKSKGPIMQKVAFDHEVASQPGDIIPPLRAILAWRNSAGTIRTHELLLRYEIALDRQISRSILRLQQFQASRPKPVESAAKPPAEPIEPPPARKPPQETTKASAAGKSSKKENASAERTQQPIESMSRRPASS